MPQPWHKKMSFTYRSLPPPITVGPTCISFFFLSIGDSTNSSQEDGLKSLSEKLVNSGKALSTFF